MLSNKILYAAGVLFYGRAPDKNLYFLLGKDLNNNRWSDFSGNSELLDKGDVETTAARECWEETLGSVFSYEEIKNQIRNNKNKFTIKSKTPSGKIHFLFVVKIPFLPTYREKFLSTKNFVSKLNIDSKYNEIADIKWVSLNTILNTLETDGKKIVKLRHAFEENLKNNLKYIQELID